jgi:hypothetical protein
MRASYPLDHFILLKRLFFLHIINEGTDLVGRGNRFAMFFSPSVHFSRETRPSILAEKQASLRKRSFIVNKKNA